MNIRAYKRFLILPIITIVSLLITSILFFNQIDKLKVQIDKVYFGSFIPMYKLHNMLNVYESLQKNKLINSIDKRIIIDSWNYYFTSYKTDRELDNLKKLDKKIKLSFLAYDNDLNKKIVSNLSSVITYEMQVSAKERKTFVIQYENMKTYLIISLSIVLILALVIVGFVIYLSMQKHTQLENLSKKYKKDSITDSLSNLYNRKHFDKIFDKLTIISKDNNWQCAFTMIDIDFFKPFNDTYGHDMGDEAIKSVAKALEKSFDREHEFVFRIGGEEFGIIMFNISSHKLEKSLKNFQRNIDELKILHSHSSTGFLTTSMGVVLINNNTNNLTVKELYKAADDKLYHSKENGRNQYTI